VTLALGFYAQFESGLLAYAIAVLGVPARTIGTASAVNCLVIVVLQMAVVKWTAKRAAPSLLVAVGSIWVLSWLLAAASVEPVLAGVALTAGHGSLFIGVHVGISLVAVFAALRLRSLLAGARVSASQPGGIPGTLEDLVLEAQPA